MEFFGSYSTLQTSKYHHLLLFKSMEFLFFLQITLERSYLVKGRLAQTVLWTSQNGEKLRKKNHLSKKNKKKSESNTFEK
jgi:hypothetical protein